MNKNKVLKSLGIVGAGVGLGYVLFQAYKHYKADEAAAIKKAEEIVKEAEENIKNSAPSSDEEVVKTTNSEEQEKAWQEYLDNDELHYNIEQQTETKAPVSNRVYHLTRKEEELRHDANSQEALDQYKDMIISDFEMDPDQHEILRTLFGTLIGSTNRRDSILLERIKEDRTRFFGKDSQFINDATAAELFIFYANRLSDDTGIDILEAMHIILEATELEVDTDPAVYDSTVSDLTQHNFWNSNDGYGLFGLIEDQYNELYEFPEVAVHKDADISYDMEYSIFMEYHADEIIESVQ